MKDASDNDSVGASISAETSNTTENVAQIPKVTAASAVTIPLVTVTANQTSDEPTLIYHKDKKKKGKKRVNIEWFCYLL